MFTIITSQLDELRERFRDVLVRQLTSGTTLVILPAMPLPNGWSKVASDIRFLIPLGYPFAPLDCFWTDVDLRLAGGGMPQNSGLNPIPEAVEPGLWFSWHLSGPWDPNRDTLSSWVNAILERMRQIR